MQKKWIAVGLAASLLLVGCSNKDDKDSEPMFQDPVPILTEAPTWPQSEPEADTQSTISSVDEIPEQQEETPDSAEATVEELPPETAPKADPQVEEVNEVVYAVAQVNVRSGPGFNHAVVGKLHGGDKVTRTGIGKHGWSRITYEGKTAYVANNYVTTDSPETAGGATFKEVKQTVKATAKVNIRKGPGVDYDVVGQLQAGEEVTRTAIGSKGWSRILHNGEVCYVANNYLKVVTNEAVPEETK